MTGIASPAPVRGGPRESVETVADLLERLGDIPPERVWTRPTPGTATEQDLIDAWRWSDRLCELDEGTLVEKAVGLHESILAGALIALLRELVIGDNRGIVAGEAGTVRLFPGLVRMPDVAFISWARLPGGALPAEPIPDLAPDLVVEILSRSNTDKEMDRKCAEYLAAGVRLVWLIDPRARTVEIRRSDGTRQLRGHGDTLDGEDVLPGFHLELDGFFGELDRRA